MCQQCSEWGAVDTDPYKWCLKADRGKYYTLAADKRGKIDVCDAGWEYHRSELFAVTEGAAADVDDIMANGERTKLIACVEGFGTNCCDTVGDDDRTEVRAMYECTGANGGDGVWNAHGAKPDTIVKGVAGDDADAVGDVYCFDACTIRKGPYPD